MTSRSIIYDSSSKHGQKNENNVNFSLPKNCHTFVQDSDNALELSFEKSVKEKLGQFSKDESDISGDISDEEIISKVRKLDNKELQIYHDVSDALSDLNSLLIKRYLNIIKIKATKIMGSIRNSSSNASIDIDDLVSEGFLGLMSAIRTYNEEKGSFYTYANVCIANKIKTAVLSGKNNMSVADNFDLTAIVDKELTEELIIEKESENEISKSISEVLSERELEVFTLYLNAFSYSQISEKLMISVKSVDNALLRARTKLKLNYPTANKK